MHGRGPAASVFECIEEVGQGQKVINNSLRELMFCAVNVHVCMTHACLSRPDSCDKIATSYYSRLLMLVNEANK